MKPLSLDELDWARPESTTLRHANTTAQLAQLKMFLASICNPQVIGGWLGLTGCAAGGSTEETCYRTLALASLRAHPARISAHPRNYTALIVLEP
jgi:hypothetical protein